MKPRSRETEAALVIRSNQAEKIARAIAQLDTLGAYRLEPQGTHKIRDVYFDTRDLALQKRKLALRIRDLDGAALITLKGQGRKKASGVNARLEIEAPWSRGALTRVLHELGARGIKIEIARRAFARTEPSATMTRLGLHAVQARTTRRQIRSVIPRAVPSQNVRAELAIDAVTFRFGKQRVCLNEVEIEAKSAQVRLGDLVHRLEVMFKPALRPWQSKLATGKAIQALLAKGILQKLLDGKNNLKPAAYDRISREFK